MRINHVLMDYENVQPEAFTGLDADHFRVLLFVGASQTKLPFDVADAMQRMGDRARYVKISGNGSNALDFHIAFYIGLMAATEPEAYFHIVSKDTGFDPLVQHLKARKLAVSRSSTIADMPCFKAANAKTTAERVDMVIAKLQIQKSARPRTVKTLTSSIASHFQKQLSEDELAALLAELQRRGIFKQQDNKVSYSLPDAP